jgi:DNA-binding IclR family transcriptional regulator
MNTAVAERGTHRAAHFTLAEFQDAADLDPSEAEEFLASFEEKGVIEQVGEDGEWSLTPKGEVITMILREIGAELA